MKTLATTGRRFRGLSLASCVATLASLAGCCNDLTTNTCFEWDEPATCPAPESAAKRLGGGKVAGPGTFWPAHTYLIEGARRTEPALCCYEVTQSVCATELH